MFSQKLALKRLSARIKKLEKKLKKMRAARKRLTDQ